MLRPMIVALLVGAAPAIADPVTDNGPFWNGQTDLDTRGSRRAMSSGGMVFDLGGGISMVVPDKSSGWAPTIICVDLGPSMVSCH